MAGVRNYPRTVEEVFSDFKGRQAGIIKALTTDFEEFFKQCHPAQKSSLCLYGLPSGQWEVRLPDEMVPAEIPEPALGINLIRDEMHIKDWLSVIAVNSDAWLLAVAFHYGARFGYHKTNRKRLFNMINDLPWLIEVVTGRAEKMSSSSESEYEHEEDEEEDEEEDMDGGNPLSVEVVFRDFEGRRAGLLKAFTTEFEEFYQQCDPEKENVSLYGFPSEKWEVTLPPEVPKVPEPALGINYAREGMRKEDWLALVAIHSDTWLLSVAYYLGVRFDKADRERLFNKINNLPTLFEVVRNVQREVKNKSSDSEKGSKESISNLKEDSESQGKDADVVQMQAKKEAEESFEDERNREVHCFGGCGLFWSFVGSIFGRWQLTIGNGCDRCAVRKS